MGLKYDYEAIDLASGNQRSDWFLKMNPNGKLPVLVDNSTGITLCESSAIMTYLTDTYDKSFKYSFEPGTPEYYKHLEILYFHLSGLGPMQSQVNHFIKFAPERIPYGIERYTNETKRLYGVLDEYLRRNEANGPYLVGDHYSVADVANFCYATFLFIGKIDIKEFPLVTNWARQLMKVPEVAKGLTIPKSYGLPEI